MSLNRAPVTATKPLRILARVDADGNTGAGHAVRVKAIVRTFGLNTELLIFGEGKELGKIFPQTEIRCPGANQSTQIADAAARFEPDLILCDLPAPGKDLRHHLDGETDVPFIVIDDFGGDYRASGVVNGTVLPAYHKYPGLRDDALRLCGGEYALLRRSFGETRPTGNRLRTIGIVVGSGERAASWAEFLTSGAVDFADSGAVGMVVGWAFPDPDTLSERCAQKGISFAQGLSEEQLASFLASSELALVTGGMISYESLAVGTPTIIFPNMQNLIAEAEWFAANSCAVNLGEDGGFDAAYLRNVIASLKADPQARTRLSRNGHRAIDGRGVSRVCTRLRDHFKLSENSVS